jgi:hypothetical protein
MKLVFLDAEFTGEHQHTTPVSFGLVGEGDEALSVTFADFDRDQVTPWLEENVLGFLDPKEMVPQAEGLRRIEAFLESYAGGERIGLVSAGKLTDIILLFQLWHHRHPDRKYFHGLYCLPPYLNHADHFDLNTMFFLAGMEAGMDRAAFAGVDALDFPVRRHDALSDARVVKACFRKLMASGVFPNAAARAP